MFFAAMNLSVHSVMYVYYGVAALGYAKNMAKMNLNIILTTGQIIQMVGGIVILYKSTNCTKFDRKDLPLQQLCTVHISCFFQNYFTINIVLKKQQQKYKTRTKSNNNFWEMKKNEWSIALEL